MSFEYNFEKCAFCPLIKNPRVISSGSIESSYWIIGEAPGKDEIREGRPFIGDSGQLLRRSFDKIGFDIESTFIINTVRCRPLDNRTPIDSEIACCNHILEQELDISVPKVILLLGKVAGSLFFKDPSRGRIKTISIKGQKVWVITAWHPSYLLRRRKALSEFEEDLIRYKQLCDDSFDEDLLAMNYKIVKSELDIKTELSQLSACKISFAFDIEATGLIPCKDKIIGISFSNYYNRGFYIPLRYRKEADGGLFQKSGLFEYPWFSMAVELIKKLLENKGIKKAAQNADYETKMLEADFDIRVANLCVDTMVIQKRLDENLDSYSLESLQYRYFPYLEKYKHMVDKYAKGGDYSYVPLEILGKYGAFDSIVCFRLAKVLGGQLSKDKELMSYYFNFSVPLIQTLADMERHGIYFDVAESKIAAEEIKKQQREFEEKIYQQAGYQFNINSAQQMAKLLYENLKLEPIKATKKGKASVDKDVLEKYAKDNPICSDILEYRKYEKLLTTYLITDGKKDLEYMDANHIVHASFSQTTAVTTRLSCSNPNLENLPVKAGPIIKKLYKPRSPDRSFIKGDYSQMELAILAWYSKDKKLLTAFAKGIDLHRQVASDINGIPVDEVTEEQRFSGKSTNFAVIFGEYYINTARRLGIPEDDAKRFQIEYYRCYPGIREFQESTKLLVHRYKFVRNCYGTIRKLPEIDSDNSAVVSRAERQAVNFRIQSTAVNYCNYNMCLLNEYLRLNYEDAYIVNQVHDEIISEQDKRDEDNVMKDFIRIAQTPVLPVDISIPIDAKIAETLAG